MNRYLQCNQQAETEKARKHEAARFTRHLWDSVWAYLDEDDVYYSDGKLRPIHQIKRRAWYALQSYVYGSESVEYGDERIAVNGSYGRNTEFEAIWNLFEVMLTKQEWRNLTRSQEETVALDHMAKVSGVNSAQLISNVLSITDKAAYARLKTVREKTLNIAPDFAILDIKAVLETTPRFCPFCHEQSRVTRIPVSTNVMCWEHHKRFVLKQDFGYYPRKEYERVITESTRDYWQKVRGALEQQKTA